MGWPGVLGTIQLRCSGGSKRGYPVGCERQGRSLRKSFQEDSPERKSILPTPKKCSSRKSVHYGDRFHLRTI